MENKIISYIKETIYLKLNTTQKSDGSPIIRNVKAFPDARQINFHGGPVYWYNGNPYSQKDRLIPTNNRPIDEDGLFRLAHMPGWKVVITENSDQMSYAALYTVIKTMEKAERVFSMGLATGGTTESLRKAMGLIDLCMEALQGLSVPGDKVNKWSTLDNYFWSKASEDLDVALSSYTQEQQYMLLNNLYGPVDYNYFVTPYDKSPMNISQSAENFRNRMRVFLESSHQILVQLHGIGSDGHDGFNEILRNLALLRSDYASYLLDITKVQNIGHFLPRGFHPFFLRFMADNKIFSMERLVAVLNSMDIEQIALKYPETRYQFKSEKQFRKELAYLIKYYTLTPGGSITQGTGDLLERTSKQGSIPLYLSCSFHKVLPTYEAIDLPPSWKNTASALQFNNSLVIVDWNAATKLDHGKCFFFTPSNYRSDLITADNVNTVWEETPPGILHQEHLQAKSKILRQNGVVAPDERP